MVGEIKRALDVRLRRKVALACAYSLLHRHGWRKLVPDKQQPKANVAAQENWKKKLPDVLAEIDQHWLSEGPIRLMFQDEARFGHASGTSRIPGAVGAPSPFGPCVRPWSCKNTRTPRRSRWPTVSWIP